MSLKFHYRMFMSRSSQTSLIVYLALVEKLVAYFQSQEGGATVTISMGIDPADDRSIKLLARVRRRERGEERGREGRREERRRERERGGGV